ncbi:hypothetical protein SASPL_143389 [Salvia splendens]|uniref:Uncharacterized protein n=1 Tax=Salvia splendens TaxID=180675 RepID=A0A8X8WLI9_SALSN|nr:hypothetical protein SASPL_143389 [Salvia splendens]
MKDGTLMPVFFCKIHCPFICFCKPSAAHLYTSAPLKLEGSPHVVHSSFAVDKSPSVVEEGSVNGNKNSETMLKSCIREPQRKEAGKKRVEWKDNTGKQLAEIKEFESRQGFGPKRLVTDDLRNGYKYDDQATILVCEASIIALAKQEILSVKRIAAAAIICGLRSKPAFNLSNESGDGFCYSLIVLLSLHNKEMHASSFWKQQSRVTVAHLFWKRGMPITWKLLVGSCYCLLEGALCHAFFAQGLSSIFLIPL